MRRRADVSGFTLIEVLVAFTIAAMLLLPLLRSFSTGVASAAKVDAFTEATLIAESTIEMIGPGVALTDGADLDQPEGQYRVLASVRRYQSEFVFDRPAPGVVPYEVAVTVSWPEGGRTRSVALRTLRLGPPAATAQAP
jgi:general secretion pathway protein I